MYILLTESLTLEYIYLIVYYTLVNISFFH